MINKLIFVLGPFFLLSVAVGPSWAEKKKPLDSQAVCDLLLSEYSEKDGVDAMDGKGKINFRQFEDTFVLEGCRVYLYGTTTEKKPKGLTPTFTREKWKPFKNLEYHGSVADHYGFLKDGVLCEVQTTYHPLDEKKKSPLEFTSQATCAEWESEN